MTTGTQAETVAPQRCGAQRPAYRPFGWTCDGTGLVKVFDGPGGVPVVVRADLLDEYRAEAVIPPSSEPEAISDRSDHMHAAVDRRLDEYQVAVSFGAWLTVQGTLSTSDPVLAWARRWSEQQKGRRP